MFSRKREKKYHKVSNRYNCLILQIQPLKSKATKKCDTKQYSFLLGKTERLHQGQDPEIMTVNAQRVLHRLECRLQKILNTAKKKQKKQWYNNDLGDAIRYTFMRRYGYLESYFGKARLFWDILLSSSFVVLFVLLIAGDYFLFH